MKPPPADVQEELRAQLENRLKDGHYIIRYDGEIYEFEFTKIALTLDVTSWTDLSDPSATVGITQGSQEKGHP